MLSFRSFKTVLPLRIILPFTILPGKGTRPIKDKPKVDFPEPDSPTMPSVSALSREKDTSSTARIFPLLVQYSTVNLSTVINDCDMCSFSRILLLEPRVQQFA